MCRNDPNLIMYSAGAKYHHEALNGTGYPEGLRKKDIPLEGQIIRVADEFDAIVSKRQYKSHIGITETLNILIEECQPSANSKYGKANPTVVKALFKVVIEDTEYEIYSIREYLEYLKEQVQRLEQINSYIEKREKTNKPNKKEYYDACINMFIENGENEKNIPYVLEEYKLAIEKKKKDIDKLFNEIKIIKKLRV